LEAEAKAKVESLQATPAPQDPVFPDPPARGRGRGRGRGKPPAVSPAPLPGPTPAAFAGVGGLEESRPTGLAEVEAEVGVPPEIFVVERRD
jgi:hypothetical protein